MNETRPIQTIESRARIENRVRGSRFIATAIPIAERDDVSDAIDDLRREFWEASHHCFAYQLSPDGSDYRFSDDGEPSGSAGKPILLVLQRAELLDTLIVVTRYFGGTKLGVGGLARAYGGAAIDVMKEVPVINRYPMTSIRVFTPYEDVGEVRRLVEETTESFTEEFKDVVIYTAQVRLDRLTHLRETLTECTAGRAGLIQLDQVDVSS